MICKATTKAGKPCQAAALRGDDYCFMHSPKMAEKRQKSRKLGGYRSRPKHSSGKPPVNIRSIDDVLELLDYALLEAVQLENSLGRGRLLVALCSEYLRALDVGDLETRLQAVEKELGIR